MNTPVTAGLVVGVDGSPDSLRAVQWAAADAGRRHVPLHLLHACGGPELRHPPAGLALPVSSWAEPGEHSARLLADAVVAARDVAVELDVTCETVDGRAVPALLAASRHAAAVVVGSRGHGGFAGLLAGSTAVQVAAHAACPAVVVRPRTGATGPNGGRVVVGVDGSPSAQYAVRFAFEQAAFRGQGLTAVHAYQLPVALEADGILPDRYEQEAVRDAERRVLSEALSGMSERYPDVEARRDLVVGRAAGAVVAACAGAELLVVGARGHGGFPELRLGSVSRAALHHAPCPVAVVRR